VGGRAGKAERGKDSRAEKGNPRTFLIALPGEGRATVYTWKKEEVRRGGWLGRWRAWADEEEGAANGDAGHHRNKAVDLVDHLPRAAPRGEGGQEARGGGKSANE